MTDRRSARAGAGGPRIALHWFRRDLRLEDNTALAAAARAFDVVVPLFVLDPALLSAPNVGAPRVAFLLDALRALDAELARRGSRLVVRRGPPIEELLSVARAVGAAAIFSNRDYSPYAVRRDARAQRAAERTGLAWHAFDDQALVAPAEGVKDDGTPYTVFTPYARRWRAFEKARPLAAPPADRLAPERLCSPAAGVALPADAAALGLPLAAEIPAAGAAAAGRRLSAFVAGKLERYASERDFPALDSTSHLSADLKFGTISARTVHAAIAAAIGADLAPLDPARPPAHLPRARATALREAGTFLNELAWRDFYQTVLFHFPHVVRAPFQRRAAALAWPPARPEVVAAWREGRTGFPIVDAAMRQLATTAWMHNRLRMVVAMFLTKTLLVDYRVGERIFMQRLVDGDVAANNGGWQWSASTGTDAAPYFRIFNPLSQSRKFDPDGAFIRRFVPELRDFPPALVHAPDEEPLRRAAAGYPAPCVDYADGRARALELFAPVLGARAT